MENHDAALPLWRERGQSRILVHVDPHHDAWFPADGVPPNAANFIGHALRERLVREWYWVVPDRSFATAENRALLLAALRKLMGSYPGRRGVIDAVRSEDSDRAAHTAQQGEAMRLVQGGQKRNSLLRTSLLGVPLTVCALDALPAVSEDILLDLDVDFMTTPRVNYSRGNDPHPDLPWCWPGELLERIAQKNLRCDIVTIALSVEGGYTPLAWKYLGEELALRLAAHPDSAGRVRGTEGMRAAAVARFAARHEDAEKFYGEAAADLPGSAALAWHRANLSLDMGREAEARQLYAEALALDPTYGTAYHSEGLWHYAAGRTKEAEREFRRGLELDPRDAIALLGLARLAMRRNRWQQAEAFLRQAIEIDPKLLDAHRSLGKALAQQRRYGEAAAAYEASLRLALAGHSSLLGSGVISTEPARWSDRRHWRTLWNLAEVRDRMGNLEQAAAAYRMAAAGGQDGVRLRARLARIAVRRKQWKEALRETLAAVKRIPGAMKNSLGVAWSSIERAWA
ncbi:MAG: tetratricopeptide repeat protein, partial [Candidatus Acidiferrales bacterium]